MYQLKKKFEHKSIFILAFGYFFFPLTMICAISIFPLLGYYKTSPALILIPLLFIIFNCFIFYIYIMRRLKAGSSSEKRHAVTNHFELILKAMPDAVFIVNNEGTILIVNDVAEKIFGYKKEELVGQPIELLVPKNKKASQINSRNAYFMSHQVRHMGTGSELFGVLKNEQQIPVEILLSPVETDIGELAIATVRDITERKIAENKIKEINRFQEAVLDTASYAIIACDEAGMIVNFNKAAERLLGYHASEVIGKASLLLFHDTESIQKRSLELSQELHTAIKPGIDTFTAKAKLLGSDTNEWIYIRKDGSRFPALLSITILQNTQGEIEGSLSIAVDITERKKIEQYEKEAAEKLQISLEQLNHRNEQLLLIKDLTSILQICFSVAEVSLLISDYCQRLLPHSCGFLYIMHHSHQNLESTLTWGATDLKNTFQVEACWALRKGNTHHYKPSNGLICEHINKEDVINQNYTCIPLMAQGYVIGLLSIIWKANIQKNDNEIIAIILAEQLSLGLASISLRERMQFQSFHDPLTGLFNRRYLEEALGKEILRAKREGITIALSLLDIDYFKKINDTHGHTCGDEVLKRVAKELNNMIRKSDIASRYGGEEFVVVLTDINSVKAYEIMERIRQAISRLQIHCNGVLLEKISISVGLVMYPENGATIEDLISNADGLLYQAKNEGRDQIKYLIKN